LARSGDDRGMVDLVSQSYPQNSPIVARPDWRPESGKPGESLEDMQRHVLDPFRLKHAICNPLYGVQMVFSEDMQAAFCRALNDWLVKEWLDRDKRLRGSIVIPTQSVEKAVAEIERCAQDRRFVQVLMLVMGDTPLGKRALWPIYEARNGWTSRSASMPVPPITIRRPRSAGVPITSRIMSVRAQAFQTQLTSVIVEGVFAKYRG
jgi:predicted TIM-barrel fold metal-dependent hydrolase